MVTQSGGRKLTYIMMVAVRNLRVEYGHCTVKQRYETVDTVLLRLLMARYILVLMFIVPCIIAIVEE